MLNRRDMLFVFGIAMLGACSRAPGPGRVIARAAGSRRAPFTVIDLMPEFWAVWENAKSASPERARALFKERMIRQHPAVYAPNVLGLPRDDEATLDARIEQWLPRLAEIEPALRRLHQRFTRQFDESTERFMGALDDFSWSGDVYVFVSMDSFNGGTRKVGGETALLFGMDVIARSQPDLNLAVLMHHELFHVYQRPSGGMLGENLWVEGLATYASIALNPGTSDAGALPVAHVHDQADPQVDAPARRVLLSSAMPSLAHDLAPRLIDALRSKDEDDYRDFFLGRATARMHAKPVRSGYWFGLEIVRRLARGRSLRALAELDPAETLPEIESELRAASG